MPKCTECDIELNIKYCKVKCSKVGTCSEQEELECYKRNKHYRCVFYYCTKCYLKLGDK